MKKKLQPSIGILLKRYHRYKRKYKKLIQSEKISEVKTGFLQKRILQLREILRNFKLKAKLAGAAGVFCFVITGEKANAQSFSPPVMNPFSLSAVNNYSSPEFADLDNDNDLDMMTGDEIGNFYYFENTGTASAPVFAAPLTLPFGLTNQAKRAALAFGDMDNDGDLDIIAGRYGSDVLSYFENTGTASAPSFAAEVFAPFNMPVDYYYSLHPFIADLDNDGDLDIIAGEYYGTYLYFENTGTPAAPDFPSYLSNDMGLSTQENGSTPTLFDLDNDGDLDLMIGSYSGNFYYFENTGTAGSPVFDSPVTNPFSLNHPGNYNSPVFADLNNDGDIEIMSGDYYGSFYYYDHCASPANPVSTTPAANLGICDGDNTTLSGTGNATLSWYDDLGNYVASGGNLVTGTLNSTTSYFLQDSTACAIGLLEFPVVVSQPIDPIVSIAMLPVAGGGTASSSANYGTNYAADAFDQDTITTGWGSASGAIPAYLEYNYGSGNGRKIDGYGFFNSSAMTGGWGSTDYCPSEWYFLGYNGAGWDTLDHQIDLSPIQDVWYNYSFTNTQSYERYRIYMVSSPGGSYVMLTEVRFYESDPCSKAGFKATSNTDMATSIFQWKVNGNNVGTNSDLLFLANHVAGDAVTCEVTTECFVTTATGISNTINVTQGGLPIVTTSTAGATITADMSGAASYQWIDCATGNNATGVSNAQSYTATTTGNYAVVIYNGTCPDTSACVSINFTGMNETSMEKSISVFPNPNNGEFQVQTATIGHFILRNELGQVVHSFQSTSENNRTVSVNGLESGLYFISEENGLYTQKVIIIK